MKNRHHPNHPAVDRPSAVLASTGVARSGSNGNHRLDGAGLPPAVSPEAEAEAGPAAVSAKRASKITANLSPADEEELSKCESIIRQGWGAFVDVGNALTIIRDKKLYRRERRTFEEYCRLKWAFKRAHAYRQINVAKVFKILSPAGDNPMPTHESQLRPLFGLPAGAVQEVWSRAARQANGGPIQRKLVQEAVDEFRRAGPNSAKVGKPRLSKKSAIIDKALRLAAEAETVIQAQNGAAPALKLVAELKACLEQYFAQSS